MGLGHGRRRDTDSAIICTKHNRRQKVCKTSFNFNINLCTFYTYNETLKIKEVVYLEPNQAWQTPTSPSLAPHSHVYCYLVHLDNGCQDRARPPCFTK